MTDAAFTFLSWVRRGLGTAISTPPGEPRTTVQVAIRFNQDTVPPNPPAPATALELVGPGDIVGLDQSVICRIWPPPDDLDAEFASYALIEFDQADLLWRYSPEASFDFSTTPNPTLLAQVRPWLTLVVMETSEASLSPPTPENPLGVLTVTDVDKLPLDDVWAWGHTQMAGLGIDPNDPNVQQALLNRINGDPGAFSARLMSPRVLRQNREYIACLVPTFERGRLVGLGELPSGSTMPVLRRWREETIAPGFKLPVYFSWRFRTGTLGNFEHGARLIRPDVLPETVGRRDMDVTDLDFDLDDASDRALPVEGALMSVAAADAQPPVWPEDLRDEFIAQLKDVLNVPAKVLRTNNTLDPKLVPPLYGQWYAAQDELLQPLPAPGTNPVWFHELNSDPRNRVGASLGTKVIQREQQALLASGWNQVTEIRSLNNALRIAQLGRWFLGRIYTRHFAVLSEQRFYHATRQLHGWVQCNGVSVCNRIKASPIVPGFLSTQWLRFTRARGPVGRFQGRPGAASLASNLLQQLNDCRRPTGQPPPPKFPDPENPRRRIPCEFITDIEGAGVAVTLFWALVILWVVRKLLVTQNGDCWWLALKALRYAMILIRVCIDPGSVRRRCKVFDGFALTVQDILTAPPMPGLNIVPFPSRAPYPALIAPGAGPDSPDAADARAALVRLLQALAPPPQLTCGPAIARETCRLSIADALTPATSVGRRILSRRTLNFPWNPVDRLEPVYAPPSYERPMYLPLSEISFDWILPGLNQMKRDSISLAVTNQRFIEAYMVGLNHEMTRELLWNEFPTDQRGTYFRQFWDVAGCVLDGSSTPPEQFRDVFPLRQWDKTKGLGGHSPRTVNGQTSEMLVLVVRAQLIQKYPNVIVYLQRRNAAANRLTGEQRHPMFYALLRPDVAFYGFQATVDEIRNDTSPNDWYFVLQEQPGDPKFIERNVPHDGSVLYSTAAAIGASAGIIAQETFLDPFRVGFAARAMLPEE